MEGRTDRDRLKFAAGFLRLALGSIALFVLPVVYPRIWQVWPVLVGYLVASGLFEVLIALRIGDRPRALAGGLVDIAFLTFVLHRVGSMGSFLSAIYVFAAMVNTLVVGQRVGLSLAILASVSYGAVVGLEVLGILPYAQDAPAWSAAVPPRPIEAFSVWVLTAALLVLSSVIMGALVRVLKERERALRGANERLSLLTKRDPLTDLWNRRHLIEQLERSLAEGPNETLALAMVDLDRFKRVNDTLGHLHGDALLRALADGLAAQAEPRDVVCRFGGDEFVVLLRGSSPESVRTRAEGIATTVREVASRYNAQCGVTASVGLTMPRAGDEAEEWIRRADERAYEAKRRGGDRVVAEDEGPLVAVGIERVC